MTAAQCPHCGHAIEGTTLASVFVPVHLVSEANQREHHQMKARRVAAQRFVTRVSVRDLSGDPAMFYLFGAVEEGRLLVKITRCEPRSLDSDNLAGAAKAVRDELAKLLDIDDKDPRVRWVVDQCKPTKEKADGTYVEMLRVTE